MGTYTTNYQLFMPSIGEQGWGTLVNGNFSTIDTTMAGLNTRLTAVESEVNGALSCTSITTSGTITSTGKITANGGIGTTSLTTSSTITSTGLITANGGVKGNLTGNVTGNLTGNVTGKITRTITPVISQPYTSNNVILYTTPVLTVNWSTGSANPGTKSTTIPALITSYTTPWGTYTMNRTTVTVTFTVTVTNSRTATVKFDNSQVYSGTGGTFTVNYNTSTSHTVAISINGAGKATVESVNFYLN